MKEIGTVNVIWRCGFKSGSGGKRRRGKGFKSIGVIVGVGIITTSAMSHSSN